MKALVLEGNDRIVQLYKSIFLQKKCDAEFASDSSVCLDLFSQKNSSYDLVILDKSTKTDIDSNLEDEIRIANPNQKIFFLSPYMSTREKEFDSVSETLDLIDKPFALVSLLSQLELKVLEK